MIGMRPLVQAFILFALITVPIAGCSPKGSPAASSGPPSPSTQPEPEKIVTGLAAATTIQSASSPDSQKIVSDCAAAMENVKAYKLDLNLTMNMSFNSSSIIRGDSPNVATRGTATVAIKAETDRVASMSHATFSLSTTIEGSDRSTNNSVEMFYASPDSMYSKVTTQWMKQPYREENMSPGLRELEEQRALLRSATDFRFLMYETLGGADNYVLELTLEPAKATSWFVKHMPFSSNSQSDEETTNLKNLAYRVWIDKSTLLLSKGFLAFTLAEDNGSGTTDVSSTTRIYDYDQPLNLAPPADAITLPAPVLPTPTTPK
jgi:hypothetical protein